MAGAIFTGKSVYIGVLRKQLDLLASTLRTFVGYLDADVQKHYQEEYERVLFETRNLIQATPPARKEGAHQHQPLVFTLGQIAGRRRALVIRDVSGEDLENGNADPHVFSFFQRADAVLFLFDPLQVEAVRMMLRGRIPKQGAGGGDPVTVLQNLVPLMRSPAAGRITVPLAVVLSKFDALQEFRVIPDDDLGPVLRNTGAAFMRDPSLDPAFDAVDANLLNAEVRSLLVKIGGDAVLNLVDHEFAVNRFFAVSALGHPAGDGLQSPLGIAPFRCLDPIKWAFELSSKQ
jgi:hypothetical protein